MWARLGDLCDINPKNSLNDEVMVSFIPMTLISDGFSNRHTSEIRKWEEVKRGFTHFREGDVGLAKITPCFENRKSVVFQNIENGYGAGTTELHILRPLLEPTISNYIIWFVKTESFIANGINCFTGAVGQQRVGKNIIEETYLPLPPLEEQKRIVSEIQRLFSFINSIEENKLLLEQFVKQTKSKILNLAIRGKLVPQDPNDEPASILLERIKTEYPDTQKKASKTRDNSHYENMPFEIPENWTWCYLEEIAIDDLGKTLDKVKNRGEYHPYLRSVNIRWGEICLDDLKEMRFADKEISQYSIEKGDLLICEGGETGRCAIWDNEENILFQNAIHRVRFYKKINPYFYMYVLWLYNDLQILEEYSKGVTIKHLTKSSLNKIPLPLPPIDEQKKIVLEVEFIVKQIDSIVAEL